MATFIGKEALEEIAKKYSQEIAMSGAYYRADVFDRMKIRVLSGLQFKSIKHVMNRKGGTTVRKQVGTAVNSQIGYLEEREMVCHLTWDHFTDNKDNYIEEAVFTVDGGVQNASYPASELAFKAIVANYGENLFDCVFHGDDTIAATADNKHLRLYTGFCTYLANDVADGRISTANGNLVTAEAIAYPSGVTDTSAFKAFKAFVEAWHQNLQNQPEVLVYMNRKTALAIAKAYANDYSNNDTVCNELGENGKPTGNYCIPLWPNITICPETSIGVGYKMIATTPYNFEYGCDTLDNRSMVSVRVGSDTDHNDISWQVQSIQGTRVLNVNPSNFCMTDATLTAISASGDYKKNVFVVTSNDTTMGTVAATVGGVATTNTTDHLAGTTLVITATKTGTNVFKGWSNGSTENPITVVTKGQPEGLVAIFAES